MSTPVIIPRTAPIPIAAKAKPFEPESLGDTIKSKLSLSMNENEQTPTRGRPCDACRRRKSRCVIQEGQAACALCKSNSQECTFVQSPQPRKRKLNGEHKEDSAPKRRSPDSAPDITPRRRDTLDSSNSSLGANSLTEDMANIGGPTLLKRTLGLQKDRYSQYIGPTTDFEPSLIDLSPFDPQDESLLSRGTLRKVSDRDTFLMLPDHNTPGHEHEIEDVDMVESIVSPHGPALVELYFSVVHPNFPILQKTVFLEKYNRSHLEISPPLLAAMYILAINWWDHSDALTGYPRPDLRELERIARASLADAMYRPKLSTVQAGLLLSQRPEGDQWAPTAQLVAIGQELGLHLDCSRWKVPLWERGLRKRLAWALYMQDKWGALVHGRPSHIFATNWAVKPLTPSDFPDTDFNSSNAEETDVFETGQLLFAQMVILSQILAEVLETFYTLSAMDTVNQSGVAGTQFVLSLAKPVQLKLKEWYAGLPACLKIDSSASASSNSILADGEKLKLMPTGFLHLAYFATEITLHRRIVRSLTPPASDSSSQAQPPAVDPYIHHICRSAAKTRLISAMDFVNRLTPAHLRSFWYFASKTNFALIGTFGSLLWATAPGREEADFYRARLEEFRWTLRVSAGHIDSGRGNTLHGVKGLTDFAIGMLDTSTGLLKSLPEKPVFSRRESELDLGGSGTGSTVGMTGSSSVHYGSDTHGNSAGMSGLTMGFTSGSMQRGPYGNEFATGGQSSESHSGLVSPSTSTSSGYEAYLAA